MSKNYRTEDSNIREQRLKNEVEAMSLRIREARKESGLTQTELSDFAGVSVSTIKRYEHCDGDMTVKKLFFIASSLNLDFSQLVSDNKFILYKYSLLSKQNQELIMSMIEKCYLSEKVQI